MRAKEFIFEAGIAYNAGKIAAQKDQFASGYQKGKDTMNKIMSPSKWFQKSEKPVETKGYRTRQSLEQASRGAQMYRSDTEVLTDLHRKLKSGAVTTNLPLDQVMLAVKSAANGLALNDEQKALLGQLSKQF